MALDWTVDELFHPSTAIACIYLSICMYYNACMMVLSDILGSGVKGTLPDMGFTILPMIPFPFLPDAWVFVALVWTGIHVAIYEKQFPLVLRRTFVCQGTMYILRGTCIVLTILPNPDVLCVVKHSAPIPIAGLLVLLGWNTTCSDVCFSGHTATLIHSALVWQWYTTDETLKRIYTVFTAIGVLLILCTHFHYSLDVTLAFLAMYTVFHKYRDMVAAMRTQEAPKTFVERMLRKIEHDDSVAPVKTPTGEEFAYTPVV